MKNKGKNRAMPGKDGENGWRAVRFFTNLFADSTPEGERKVIIFIKRVLILAVLWVALLLLSQHVETWVEEGRWLTTIIASVTTMVLMGAEALSLFVLKKEGARFALYALQAITAFVFIALTQGGYALLLYILIISQFYLDAKSSRAGMRILIASLCFYALSYATQLYLLQGGEIRLFDVLRDSLGALMLLVLHFVVLQFALSFYRQYLRLNRTLEELDYSKKELEKAYEVVAEVSALEERQRIAKEIHDTAGHSLTTVIMQTETAKRLLETDPQEAKKKIISANLQAKTTLERLRDSVHLLSGSTEGLTLKNALENIVRESMDGTEIHVRSQIQDLVTTPEQTRFFCNVLREGISNGLRHGMATAFWLEVKKAGEEIYFLLSDNGSVGAEKPIEMGYGLRSMQAQAEKLGGRIAYFQDEEGFELRVVVVA